MKHHRVERVMLCLTGESGTRLSAKVEQAERILGDDFKTDDEKLTLLYSLIQRHGTHRRDAILTSLIRGEDDETD